jgi:hypothetical protein
MQPFLSAIALENKDQKNARSSFPDRAFLEITFQISEQLYLLFVQRCHFFEQLSARPQSLSVQPFGQLRNLSLEQAGPEELGKEDAVQAFGLELDREFDPVSGREFVPVFDLAFGLGFDPESG